MVTAAGMVITAPAAAHWGRYNVQPRVQLQLSQKGAVLAVGGSLALTWWRRPGSRQDVGAALDGQDGAYSLAAPGDRSDVEAFGQAPHHGQAPPALGIGRGWPQAGPGRAVVADLDDHLLIGHPQAQAAATAAVPGGVGDQFGHDERRVVDLLGMHRCHPLAGPGEKR